MRTSVSSALPPYPVETASGGEATPCGRLFLFEMDHSANLSMALFGVTPGNHDVSKPPFPLSGPRPWHLYTVPCADRFRNRFLSETWVNGPSALSARLTYLVPLDEL